MKLTKSQLKRIIKEELNEVLPVTAGLAEAPEDDASRFEDYIINNPLPGMTSDMSFWLFDQWLPDVVRRGIHPAPRTFDDVIAAYEKLRRIQDLGDPSHLPENLVTTV